MATYLFKCTARNTCGGGKVPKGATIQVVSQNAVPLSKDICEALKNQLVIQVPPGLAPSAGDFKWERVK